MPPLLVTPDEHHRLLQLTRTAAAPVVLRALAILWASEGVTVQEIAARLFLGPALVSRWLEEWRESRLESIQKPTP